MAYQDFSGWSRERLIELLTGPAHRDEVATHIYLELHHRDAKEQADRMEAATNTMRNLTWAIAGMTVVNLLFVVLTWARWQP